MVAAIAVATIGSSSASTLFLDPGPPPVKIYVKTTGSDTLDGKTIPTAVRSVRRAVELGGSQIVLVGPTYELPLLPEHKLGGKIPLPRSILLVSNQTPWEQAPSSSKGGFTEIIPAKNPNGKSNIDYRFLRLAGDNSVNLFGGGSGRSVSARFLKFQNTELWGDGLHTVRYQGD